MNLDKLKTPISGFTGCVIIVATVVVTFGVGIGGALLGSEYESSCSSKAGEEPVCTTRYAYKGMSNIDIDMSSLQQVAWIIGTGFGAYATFKAGKLPKHLEKMFTPSPKTDEEAA